MSSRPRVLGLQVEPARVYLCPHPELRRVLPTMRSFAMKYALLACLSLFLFATVGCGPDEDPDAVERVERDADEKAADGPEATVQIIGVVDVPFAMG